MSRPLRLSVSGAPGSGKTTLWKAMRSELERRGLRHCAIGDLPRDALQLAGTELLDDAVAFQHWVGIAQLVAESSCSPASDYLLLDKSLVDATAYWRTFVGAEEPSWRPDENRYDVVAVCDLLDIAQPGDRLQGLHWEARETIEEHCISIGREAGRRLVIVSGSMRERLDRLLAELES